MCGAAPDRVSTPAIARTLLRWAQETHPVQDDTLPGLVWAITPGDARFSGEQHLDDGVQRLLGKPGQRWGTLQALEAIKLLSGIPGSHNQLRLFDGRRHQWRSLNLQPAPHCPVCGGRHADCA